MSTWIAPFPRLRYRLRNGQWCDHQAIEHPGCEVVYGTDIELSRWEPGFGEWHLVDLGRRKLRQCQRCYYAEIT